MHACKRTLLALAVGAILLPAVALADKPTGAGQGKPTSEQSMGPAAPVSRIPVTRASAPRAVDHSQAKDQEPRASDADDADDTNDAKGGTGSGQSSDSAVQTNPGKGNWWADIDADADGRISRAEAEGNAGLDARFGSVDTDGDGFATRDEYLAYWKANASQGAEHAQDHSAVVAADLWRRFDADGDGRLTAVEIDLDARFKADFDAIDADNDGFVSDAEYRAFHRTD